MSLISQFLLVADRYGQAEGITDATISTRVFNDGKKLGLLRAGKVDIGTRRLEGALVWMSENWPAKARWPKGVRRPARAEAAAQ